MTEITKVSVLGTGVLGAQIAYQTAYSGFDVVAYDINDAALEKARETFAGLVKTYKSDVEGAKDGKADEAFERITLTSDLADAAKDADLIIEAVPEKLDLKKDVFGKLNDLAPEKTIFATNSSSLLPSDISPGTGRPDRFLALHFANQIWTRNTAEVMRTHDTDPAVFDTVVEFAKSIGMIAIPIYKERRGYVLNSLLIPLCTAAVDLAAGGYTDPETVDEVWRIAIASSAGPFRMLDEVGANTTYNILMGGDEHSQELGGWIKENYLDKGRTGKAAGKGFYDYS